MNEHLNVNDSARALKMIGLTNNLHGKMFSRALKMMVFEYISFNVIFDGKGFKMMYEWWTGVVCGN